MERVRDNDACAKALADAVETASREAIEKRGTFAVALAGGVAREGARGAAGGDAASGVG